MISENEYHFTTEEISNRISPNPSAAELLDAVQHTNQFELIREFAASASQNPVPMPHEFLRKTVCGAVFELIGYLYLSNYSLGNAPDRVLLSPSETTDYMATIYSKVLPGQKADSPENCLVSKLEHSYSPDGIILTTGTSNEALAVCEYTLSRRPSTILKKYDKLQRFKKQVKESPCSKEYLDAFSSTKLVVVTDDHSCYYRCQPVHPEELLWSVDLVHQPTPVPYRQLYDFVEEILQ